ncbi:MAG: flippase [Erysipelotrichaceae bacterium]
MEKKSITTNFFYNALYQILITALPIITQPYITRVLGGEALGIHAFTEANVTYFMLIGSLGISLYGCRKIAYIRDDPNKLSKTTWEIILLKLFLAVITLFVYLGFIMMNSQYRMIYIIQIINILANAIEISWFYQGIEDFKKITIRNIFVKIVFVICLFVFIHSPQDLYLYVFLIVLSALLGNFIMWIYLPRYIKPLRQTKNVQPLQPFIHLRGTLSLFIPQITVYVYSLLDRTMLGLMTTNKSNVAFYDNAQRLIRIIVALLQSLGYVMMSRISNLSASNDIEGIKRYIEKSINFTLFLAFPMMFGLMGIAEKFIPFYLGEEFASVANVVLVLSPIIIAIALNSVLGVQLLVSIGHDKQYTVATTVGALSNMILNFILIPIYGVYGACVASIFAEFLVLIVQTFFVREYLNIRNIIKKNLLVMLTSFLMFLIVYSIGKLHLSILLIFLIQILIGSCFYFAVMLIFKNEMMKEVTNKVFGMLHLSYRVR